MVSNSRKIYILGKIHTTMTSRSHIPPVSNKAHGLWWEPIFYFVRRLWAMDGGCLNKSRWYDDM